MKAVKESEQKEEGHVRRAKKIWKLKHRIRRGKWIAGLLDDEWTYWYQLHPADQDLYRKFAANELQSELEELLRTPPGARFEGAGSSIARMNLMTS